MSKPNYSAAERMLAHACCSVCSAEFTADPAYSSVDEAVDTVREIRDAHQAKCTGVYTIELFKSDEILSLHSDGAIYLSADAPKEIADIEKQMAKKSIFS